MQSSPRFSPPRTPARAMLIHGAVMLLWVLLFARAFVANNIFAWSAGIAYIVYDTVLLGFVFCLTLRLYTPRPPPSATGTVTLGVIVAAYNEAGALPVILAALAAQTDTPEEVIIADDGSSDGTLALLAAEYGIVAPPLGALSRPSPVWPRLRWLRLPHQGKAQALNAALLAGSAEVVMTVDADTLLEPDAVAAMRRAFAADPDLVAATGVMKPICGPSPGARLLEWFQTYEYVRNFLSRYAWGRMNSLLLVSGAFAGYRLRAVRTVGGFDTDSLVEDYELIHRLRHYARSKGLAWRTTVLGDACARTDAPGTIGAFLRQRRRWFGGFLQTQIWYRDMIGDPGYGALGTMMLPVKAIDTMQPIYGLLSVALLLAYAVTGRLGLVGSIGLVVGGKIVLDIGFHLWGIVLYRRWTGGRNPVSLGGALLASLVEPFSFQILRHLGAALGWVTLLTGNRSWGAQARAGLGAIRPPTATVDL
jgi:cellulose synthase/poly-beta-1,6-N-acetylglucosamine synthase-like glycosyltransferase